MTLEQVTRMKGSAYSIAGGIACLVIAYPYAFTTPKEGNPGPEVAFLFTAVGLALVVTAGVRSYKVRKSGTPSVTTDLRASIGLFVAGLIALAASFLVDYIMLGEELLALLFDAGFWWRRSASSSPDGLPASCAPPLQRQELVNHD
jgi:hypothetical protein